jgi:hypothetical protein
MEAGGNGGGVVAPVPGRARGSCWTGRSKGAGSFFEGKTIKNSICPLLFGLRCERVALAVDLSLRRVETPV